MNMLLQILEDGRLTDAQGRTVNFKNSVIIMTSNVGARLITDKKTLGFTGKSEEQQKELDKNYEETKKEVLAELKKQFRPEFLNRIDEIIVFHQLTDEEIGNIIDMMLKEVVERVKQQDITINVDESVKKLISKTGVDKTYGARPLRRAIQSLVEDKLAEGILDQEIKSGDTVKIIGKDDKVMIEK